MDDSLTLNHRTAWTREAVGGSIHHKECRKYVAETGWHSDYNLLSGIPLCYLVIEEKVNLQNPHHHESVDCEILTLVPIVEGPVSTYRYKDGDEQRREESQPNCFKEHTLVYGFSYILSSWFWGGDEDYASYHEGDSYNKFLLELLSENKIKNSGGEHTVHGEQWSDDTLVQSGKFSALESKHDRHLETYVE